MISTLAASRSAVDAALMAALVAQKMKAGVRSGPCGVLIRPTRARLAGLRANFEFETRIVGHRVYLHCLCRRKSPLIGGLRHHAALAAEAALRWMRRLILIASPGASVRRVQQEGIEPAFEIDRAQRRCRQA